MDSKHGSCYVLRTEHAMNAFIEVMNSVTLRANAVGYFSVKNSQYLRHDCREYV